MCSEGRTWPQPFGDKGPITQCRGRREGLSSCPVWSRPELAGRMLSGSRPSAEPHQALLGISRTTRVWLPLVGTHHVGGGSSSALAPPKTPGRSLPPGGSGSCHIRRRPPAGTLPRGGGQADTRGDLRWTPPLCRGGEEAESPRRPALLLRDSPQVGGAGEGGESTGQDPGFGASQPIPLPALPLPGSEALAASPLSISVPLGTTGLLVVAAPRVCCENQVLCTSARGGAHAQEALHVCSVFL